VATFPEIMASQPSAFQSSTLSTLVSSGRTLATAWSLFQNVSNLTKSWGGSAQTAQTGQAGNLANSGQQVMMALSQTQSGITSGATQMQAAKVKLTAIVTAATTEGFVVLPSGQVILGPAQISAASVHPGLGAYFQARAAMYNGQITATVGTTTMSDLQVGLSLANTAVSIIQAFKNNNNANANAAAALPTFTDPTTLTGTAPIAGATNSMNPTLGTGLGNGTALASGGALLGALPDTSGGLGLSGLGGAGGLGGAAGISGLGGAGAFGSGVAGAGGGGIGGVAGMGGIGAAEGMGGVGGVGSVGGVAGAPGSGLVGGTPGGAAAGGAMGGGRSAGGNSMVGMGGQGGGRMSDEEREARGWLLSEDEEAWSGRPVPDTTDGVLS
jgi:hypothetical protein